MLGYLFPREAASLMAQTDEAAMSRLWGGIHVASDIRVGLAFGRAVARRVVVWSTTDGASWGVLGDVAVT